MSKPQLNLKELTLEEKCDLADEIFADIYEQLDNLPSPAWHEEVLAERRRRLDAGEVEVYDFQECMERLKKRFPLVPQTPGIQCQTKTDLIL